MKLNQIAYVWCRRNFLKKVIRIAETLLKNNDVNKEVKNGDRHLFNPIIHPRGTGMTLKKAMHEINPNNKNVTGRQKRGSKLERIRYGR